MKTLTLTIQQLEAIIKNAKKEQKANGHFSDTLEIQQHDTCTTVLLKTSDSISKSDVITNEFYNF